MMTQEGTKRCEFVIQKSGSQMGTSPSLSVRLIGLRTLVRTPATHLNSMLLTYLTCIKHTHPTDYS